MYEGKKVSKLWYNFNYHYNCNYNFVKCILTILLRYQHHQETERQAVCLESTVVSSCVSIEILCIFCHKMETPFP